VDQLKRRVDVPPAQRQELPEPQAGEGRDREENRVLSVGGVCREQLDLAGLEHVEVARAPLGAALDLVDGVRANPVDALGALEDRADLLQPLVRGAVRQPGGDQAGDVIGDRLGGDRLERRRGAELGEQLSQFLPVSPHR
jgi:hypothetical protein